ncbi:MAG: acyl-CoA dehydrogenase family protein [Solirubrobacteraceae bacterium]
MPAERNLPTSDAREIVMLARDFATRELAPLVAEAEASSSFPREAFRALGALGLLSVPYPIEHGGGGQPYEVYLQALEEIASVWPSVAVGVSVHAMACYPIATWGTPAQQERLLGEMLGGALLGAYCLSEADAGSDPAAMRASAAREAESYVLSGTKAWVTHGGEADFYTVFARTSRERSRGVSCFHVPGDANGLAAEPPERKMGLTASTTAAMRLERVQVGADALIGMEGQGLAIALQALDSGRLGIAAVATGLAQAALDEALAYARERETFGRPIVEHDGLGFLLADMAAAVAAARAVTLEAARRRDAGLAFHRQASIAKLLATDAAMRVSTDAVQVLGGYGYTKDFSVERLMRDAKAMQIFEGTNQIQRLVIARDLARSG